MSQESLTSKLDLDQAAITKEIEVYRLNITLQASKIIDKLLNREGEEVDHTQLLSNIEKDQINAALKVLEIAYKSS
ncbi:MAG: hypothetical protein HEQ14_14640 [Aphanizomenon flos-aquae CP01]|nr:hypothetical protein [Aphanizomenon flos-aquae CP01]